MEKKLSLLLDIDLFLIKRRQNIKLWSSAQLQKVFLPSGLFTYGSPTVSENKRGVMPQNIPGSGD